MLTLVDTFNDRVISRHNTLEAAARAEVRFDRATNAGAGSYIPTAIIDAAGNDLRNTEEYYRANHAATYARRIRSWRA